MTLSFQDEQTVRNIVREEVKDEVKTQLTEFHSGVYDKLDQVIGELKAMREEQTVASHRLVNHENRIEILEKHNVPTTKN